MIEKFCVHLLQDIPRFCNNKWFRSFNNMYFVRRKFCQFPIVLSANSPLFYFICSINNRSVFLMIKMITCVNQASRILPIICIVLKLRKVSLTLLHLVKYSMHRRCFHLISFPHVNHNSVPTIIPQVLYILISLRINCSLLPVLRWTDVQSTKLLMVPMKR